jgi:chitinase
VCDNTSEGASTTTRAIVAWTKAGFPASKLFLGLPLYGYASSSVFAALVDSPSVGSYVNRRYKSDVPGHGKFLEGQIGFKDLLASGALEKKNNLTYVASKSNGYMQGAHSCAVSSCWRDLITFIGWDDCSGAPFIYNDGRQTMVTYDDPISLSQKALFARRSGLAGCVTWSLDLVSFPRTCKLLID